MSRKQRPRWMLHAQAQFWRALMRIGMILHKIAPPQPPKPKFSRTIPTTVSPRPGEISLHFYVPKTWDSTCAGFDDEPQRFPLVVNFHGGGFTLGRATDDARWCATVVKQLNAVVVSVDYRLAPEHPFPTAVEDGADAIMYLVSRADELCLDIERIAVSGFSSGGNMCFTVPLRLQEELDHELAEGEMHRESVVLEQRPPLQKAFSRGRTLVRVQRQIHIRAVVSWYPSTDYTHTREQRRATSARVDQQLPAIFTDLFDESYLQPPTMDMAHPYLSPGVAPGHLLSGLPDEIIMFTCEWDMLLAEAERFRDRLRSELRKTVHYSMIPEVPHGWDKAPNPITPSPGAHAHYLRACEELGRIFDE